MEHILSGDPYGMNWFRDDYTYAGTLTPEGMEASVTHEKQGDVLKTKVVFKNVTDKPIFTSKTTVGIRFPLEDRYEGSEICLKRRCHAHIFCGENISYISALRMGGEAPHLGMLLTEGSLAGYSVERNLKKSSNDRGCFILHPSPMELLPGEESVLSWVIFPHEGKEDFYEKAASFGKFLRAEASAYVLYQGESCHITVKANFNIKKLTVAGETAAENLEIGEIAEILFKAGETGEKAVEIRADDVLTHVTLIVKAPLEELSGKRCRFIAEKQQYEGRDPDLRGAYLTYDNEEEHLFYAALNDYNAGRERVGMGVLLIRWLQTHRDQKVRESLDRYTDFILRELVDKETGLVTNDYKLDDSYKRLYNAPWFATYFTELYELTSEKENLVIASNIVRRFYRDGGERFYPLELPIMALCDALKKEGMEALLAEMKALFILHADRLMEIGKNYPPSEVNYEQSIVAPACNILLQTAFVTGEEKYLLAGREQLGILELFSGLQPDAHLYFTGIRHWDGFWFGKKKCFGDTFPHYWSALSGNCYALYGLLTKDAEYIHKAAASLRGVLPLFMEDGRASCACLYPLSINGQEGSFYDPYANDQDWGLYMNLRFRDAEKAGLFKDIR